MADAATVPVKTSMQTALRASNRSAPHPCNAYPDLYPAGDVPLGTGLIHEHAADCLAVFLQAHLDARGCSRSAVWKDPLLHAPRGMLADPDVMVYTRPDVLAYKALREGRDPANAFHVGYDGPPDLVVEILSHSTWTKDIGVGAEVADKMRHYQRIGVSEYWVYNPELLQRRRGLGLFMGFSLQGDRYVAIKPQDRCWPSAVLGTLWEKGDMHNVRGGAAYMLMRLRKPGGAEWYPTSQEKDAEARRTDELLVQTEQRNKALQERIEALQHEVSEKGALLAHYKRLLGLSDSDQT